MPAVNNIPVGRGMEAVIVARGQVDDAVEEVVVGVQLQLLLVVAIGHVVDVAGLGTMPGLGAQEPPQRVRHTFHLLQDSILHLAEVQDLAICWACLN